MINKFQCEDIKIEPIRENAVPIVITPHKGFIPSMAVLFQSIIDNSCEDDFYDIIIIHSVISEDIQERYKELFAGRQNFSLRFFHILKYIVRYSFFQKLVKKGSAYIATYYRLLIPELLYKYDKVIYLDADTIVKTNIALMMEFDISNVMVGAVRDIAGNRFYYSNKDLKTYRDEVIKLKNPDNYFNAGVMIMNPNAFTQKYTKEEWWEFVASRKWRSLDQDILNAACVGNVLIISCTWNYVEMREKRMEGHISEEDMEDMLRAMVNPCIIHYVGQYKPWTHCTIPYFEEFWYYAVRNSFFEDNFKMMGKSLAEERILERIQEGSIGLKSAIKILLTWVSAWLKRRFFMRNDRTEL